MAQNILERMERLTAKEIMDVSPDIVSYNTCLNAWAKSSSEDALVMAERLVQHMKDQYSIVGNIDAKPDVITYNTLLTAYGRRSSRDEDALQRILEILADMEEQYNSGVDETMRPSAITYNNAINAFAKSTVAGKAKQAQMILESMKRSYDSGNLDAKPNLFAFTSVMNACAYTKGDQDETLEALKILWSTFNDLCDNASDYGGPNHVTYITLLKALRDLMPMSNERDEIIKKVFQRCIRDGEVNQKVLVILKSALPLDDFRLITGSDSISRDSIPADWRRNVHKRHKV
uniref:Pentacotripeptide-repeat region of PRORP domain-containing protein n=1 Tax=Leptocylindrus danicus TaxID=163516 RepID=A0A7S2KPV6_9STRA